MYSLKKQDSKVNVKYYTMEQILKMICVIRVIFCEDIKTSYLFVTHIDDARCAQRNQSRPFSDKHYLIV